MIYDNRLTRMIITGLITSGWWAWAVFAIPNMEQRGRGIIGVVLTLVSLLWIAFTTATDVKESSFLD